MGVSDRLRRLDSRVFKSMRQPDEPAEDFLRRVAAQRWPGGRAMPIEVQRALRELFARLDSD
jgi:hypothetical protein